MSDHSSRRPSESRFNYCLFAKSLVAFPALSVVAFLPVMLLDTPVLQATGATFAVIGTVCAALWLDRLPALRKKIPATIRVKR